MNISIAGSGELAARHINYARSYEGVNVIGIVDENLERAKLTAKAHDVPASYKSIQQQVGDKKPDIVHVLLPPVFHYDICKQIISSGCCVLLYAPVTETHERALELYEMAQENGVSIYVLYDPVITATARKLRKISRLFNEHDITRIECYCGLQEERYKLRSYVKPNVLHWYHSLPGNIYQKYMADMLYIVFPYVRSNYSIRVDEKSSGTLPQNISDELDIELSNEEYAAYFKLSTKNTRRSGYIKLFSPQRIVTIDLISGSTCIEGATDADGAIGGLVTKIKNLYSKTGYSIRHFIYSAFREPAFIRDEKASIYYFYDSYRYPEKTNTSITDALSINCILDDINSKLCNVRIDTENYVPPEKNEDTGKGIVLVTGGTGLFGGNLVRQLSDEGYRVRVLARKLSNIEALRRLGVEIYYGDVGCVDSLKKAVGGVDYVVHAAADTDAVEDPESSNTVTGTRNIINLAKSSGVKKFVYVSSCSVYEVSSYQAGDVIDESGKIESYPDKRGGYSYAKIIAEEIVRGHIKDNKMKVVCVRPGTYIGPGKYIYTPIVGVSFKRRIFIVFDKAGLVLPLIYYENVAAAIVAVIEGSLESGDIYNLVDDNPVTKKKYVELFLKRLYPDALFIYVPYGLIYIMVSLQEYILSALGKSPFITRYRLVSSQNPVIYDSRKIRQQLNWNPPYTLNQAFEKIINIENNIKGKE